MEGTMAIEILLIDDDPDFVQATKKVLESKPYDVIVAYNGEEGLQKTQDVIGTAIVCRNQIQVGVSIQVRGN